MRPDFYRESVEAESIRGRAGRGGVRRLAALKSRQYLELDNDDPA